MFNKHHIITETLSDTLRAKVGNTLLGADKQVARLQNKEVEPNTDWEEYLDDQIVDWLLGATDEVAEFYTTNKDILDSLKTEFPEVMKPPIGQVYRIAGVSPSSIINTIRGIQPTKTFKQHGYTFIHVGKVPYTPRRAAQSWTYDMNINKAFIESNNSAGKSVCIVYVTKVNNDFIFNPKFMNIKHTGNPNDGEWETVRVRRTKELLTGFICLEGLMISGLIHLIPAAADYFDTLSQDELAMITPGKKLSSKNYPKYKQYIASAKSFINSL